jgi:hypothetical protein
MERARTRLISGGLKDGSSNATVRGLEELRKDYSAGSRTLSAEGLYAKHLAIRDEPIRDKWKGS